MNLYNSDLFESRHLGLNHNDEQITWNENMRDKAKTVTNEKQSHGKKFPKYLEWYGAFRSHGDAGVALSGNPSAVKQTQQPELISGSFSRSRETKISRLEEIPRAQVCHSYNERLFLEAQVQQG